MANDILTLSLDGDDVPFAKFATAVREFDLLIRALGANGHVRWTLQGLEYGSATTAAVGKAQDVAAVENAARNYIIGGRAVQDGAPIPFPEPISRHFRNIARLVGDDVPVIRFITAEAEADYRAQQPLLSPAISLHRSAYGAVEGRVQTVSETHGLRFVVYEKWTGKPVNCFLREGLREIMRDAWGRRALVEGWVSRDRYSGRAVSVRDVTAVVIQPDRDVYSYRRARGALPLMGGEALPEIRLRELRDADAN